jgi:hypothetical protein
MNFIQVSLVLLQLLGSGHEEFIGQKWTAKAGY